MNRPPFLEEPMDEDQKDYNDYIGKGEATIKPPDAKKMRLIPPPNDPKIESEESIEPKSMDIFASSSSQPEEEEEPTSEISKNDSGGYETCPESLDDENATIRPDSTEKPSKTVKNEPKSMEITSKSSKSPEIDIKLAENPRKPSDLAENSGRMSVPAENGSKLAENPRKPSDFAENGASKSSKLAENGSRCSVSSEIPPKLPILAESALKSSVSTGNGLKSTKLAENGARSSENHSKSLKSTENAPKSSEIIRNQSKSSENGSKSSKSMENGSKSAENPRKLAGKDEEDEDEIVADSQGIQNPEYSDSGEISDNSLEIDEKFDETDVYEKLKKRPISRRQLIDNSNDSNEEDDEVVENMQAEMREAIRVEQSAAAAGTESPDIFASSDDVIKHSAETPEKKRRSPSPSSCNGSTSSSSAGILNPGALQPKQCDRLNSHHVDDVNGEEEDEKMEVDEYEEENNRTSPPPTLKEIVTKSEISGDEEQEMDTLEPEENQTGSETKAEATCRKEIARVSLEKSPVYKYEDILSDPTDRVEGAPDDEDIEEEVFENLLDDPSKSLVATQEFGAKNLIFRPDFRSKHCDAKKNYVYCDIPGLEGRKIFHFEKINEAVLLPQSQWRPVYSNSRTGKLNPRYLGCKKWMANYLKEHRFGTSCFQLFSHLLHETNQLSEYQMFPALSKYMYRASKEFGSEEKVLDQFARLVRIAHSAEEVLPERIYLLNLDSNGDGVESATLSHEQCAALVARMFFYKRTDFSFLGILNSNTEVAVEKLRFLFAYFDRIDLDPPEGCVSFRLLQFQTCGYRQALDPFKDNDIPDVKMHLEMRIEDTFLCSQVDFANECLGGGVLGEGAVQEEIRFLMCPEMMVGMLLKPAEMTNDEAISIVGAYTYSSYEGYSRQLKWRPLKEINNLQNMESLRDQYGRLRVETIAIDAKQYSGSSPYNLSTQLNVTEIVREHKKALRGFTSQPPTFDRIPIVTGWWGCGAFGGNKALKFLIQVVAAGMANRPLDFCAFGDVETSKKCEKMLMLLKEKNVSCGDLLFMLKNFGNYNNRYTEFFVFDMISNKLKTYVRNPRDNGASTSSSNAYA